MVRFVFFIQNDIYNIMKLLYFDKIIFWNSFVANNKWTTMFKNGQV